MKVALLSDIHFNYSQAGNINTANMLIDLEHKEKPDYIIIAGDIASSKLWDIEEFFILLRKITKLPTYIVWGNHDYWGCREASVQDYNDKWLTPLLEKYNILHLHQNPIETETVFITGHDGWYFNRDSPTNDRRFIRDYDTILFNEFRRKSAQEFDKCIRLIGMNDKKTTVYVNHFSVREEKEGDAAYSENFYYSNPLKTVMTDYVLFGHSHRRTYFYEDIGEGYIYPAQRITYINGGSNYGKPRAELIRL